MSAPEKVCYALGAGRDEGRGCCCLAVRTSGILGCLTYESARFSVSGKTEHSMRCPCVYLDGHDIYTSKDRSVSNRPGVTVETLQQHFGWRIQILRGIRRAMASLAWPCRLKNFVTLDVERNAQGWPQRQIQKCTLIVSWGWVAVAVSACRRRRRRTRQEPGGNTPAYRVFSAACDRSSSSLSSLMCSSCACMLNCSRRCSSS